MEKSGKTVSLKQGTNKSPPAVDASMKVGKGSVNNGAVRKSTASSPKTLGPRNA